MNLQNFKKLIFCFMVVWGLASFGFSMADTPSEEFPFVYLFHLYYDNGRLFADRDFEFKYDLIAEPFVQQQLASSMPYKGEVVSLSSRVLGSFQFDPTVAKGKISVKGPYFNNADKVNFHNENGVLVLTLSVAESSVCNEDGVCDLNFGESYDNCPSDCEPPPAPGIGTGREFNLTNIIFTMIAVALGLLVLWMVWTIIKKRRGSDQLPPELPASPASSADGPAGGPPETPTPPNIPPVTPTT